MPPWEISKQVIQPTSIGLLWDGAGGDVDFLIFSGSASANTKGLWFEMTPSTPYDTNGFFLTFGAGNVPSADYTSSLIDLAVGADGSEVPILNNVPFLRRRGGWQQAFFPVSIPSGTRLSVRIQNGVANQREARAFMQLMRRNFTSFPSQSTRVSTLGANVADSGGAEIDPGGSLNTKGAYTELTAATEYPLKWIIIFPFIANLNSVAADGHFLLDVAIGANGSETIIIHDLPLTETVSTDAIYPDVIGPLPVHIPAGSRVAVRAQADINDATDRLFDVIIIGGD